MNRISVLIKETPESSLASPATWRHSKKMAICEWRIGPSPDTRSVGLDISDPRTMKSKCLLFKPLSPRYFCYSSLYGWRQSPFLTMYCQKIRFDIYHLDCLRTLPASLLRVEARWVSSYGSRLLLWQSLAIFHDFFLSGIHLWMCWPRTLCTQAYFSTHNCQLYLLGKMSSVQGRGTA